MNSSVRRMAPNGSDPRRSITPSAVSASSSDPPPMSTITDRPTPMSKCATALRKLSRASSSPSSTRTLRPVVRAISARKPLALLASRTALVATASMRTAPSWRANVAMRSSASIAWRIDSDGQFARGAEARGEARRGFHFIDDLNRSFGRDVGDDLANRVRADIDRGDATMSRSYRSPRTTHRGPAEESWTRWRASEFHRVKTPRVSRPDSRIYPSCAQNASTNSMFDAARHDNSRRVDRVLPPSRARPQ